MSDKSAPLADPRMMAEAVAGVRIPSLYGPTVFPPVPGDNGQAAHDRPPFRVNGVPAMQPTLRELLQREVEEAAREMLLPSDPAVRKGLPICTGVLDYFPRALAEVARVSKAGNDQHNPGQPLHWDKTKSMDHADCIPRHLIDRFARDDDGQRHAAKLAWRALAFLEILLADEAAR